MSEDNSEVLDPHTTDLGAAGIPAGGSDTPEEKVSADGNIIERDGRKYMPIEAVHEARAEARKAKDIVKALEPFAGDLQNLINQRSSGGKAAVERATAAQPEGDYTEDELRGVAVLNRYELENGEPDFARSKQMLDIMKGVTDRSVQRHTKPLRDMTMQDRAEANIRNMQTATTKDGQQVVNPAYLDKWIKALPPDVLADPMMSQLVQLIAVGHETLDERATGKRQRREPSFSEGSTSRYDASSGSSDNSRLDEIARRARGKSPEEWEKAKKAVGNDMTRESILENW